MLDVSQDEAAQIEAAIDAAFDATPPPADNLSRAHWAFCATAEAFHLGRMLALAPAWFDDKALYEQSGTIAVLDRYKFAMRHAFDLCRARLPKADATAAAAPITDAEHGSAMKLVAASTEYALASKLFSGYHGKSYRIVRDNPGAPIKFYQDPLDVPYLALDIFRDNDEDGLNVIPFMMGLFASGQNRIGNPTIPILGSDMAKIISSVTIKGNRLRYQLITNWARTIRDALKVGPFVIPPNWHFPWGEVEDIRGFFGGLFARCLYHLLAVTFRTLRADKVRLNHICLNVSRATLIDDIERLAQLDRNKIAPILDALTLGNSTETPDPALQPLIPIGGDHLALPCLLIASCNYDRNLLSLHARVDKAGFDAQSHAFEAQMIKGIGAKIAPHLIWKSDLVLQVRKKTEQVDLIIADSASAHLLLCELRWMIRPGDTREVVNRRRESIVKVGQARRKLDAARAATPTILRKLEISDGRNWQTDAVVVIDGFGGISSPQPEIPIVPKEVFLQVLSRMGRIDTAYSFFKSRLWLPRTGVDFQYSFSDSVICGTKVSAHVMSQGPKDYLRESLPRYIAEGLRERAGDTP